MLTITTIGYFGPKIYRYILQNGLFPPRSVLLEFQKVPKKKKKGFKVQSSFVRRRRRRRRRRSLLTKTKPKATHEKSRGTCMHTHAHATLRTPLATRH